MSSSEEEGKEEGKGGVWLRADVREDGSCGLYLWRGGDPPDSFFANAQLFAAEVERRAKKREVGKVYVMVEGDALMEALSAIVSACESLTSLHLSWCPQLSSFSAEAGWAPALTSLNLSGCSKLSSFSAEAGWAPSLTSLDLSMCSQLSSFSAKAGWAPAPESLRLFGCKRLPIQNAVRLFESSPSDAFRNLHLGDCGWSDATAAYFARRVQQGSSEQPVDLSLRHNNFTNFPLSVWSASTALRKRIRSLHIDCFTLRYPPRSIALDPMATAELLRLPGARHLPSVHAALVGHGAVGKTTLRRCALDPDAGSRDQIEERRAATAMAMGTEEGVPPTAHVESSVLQPGRPYGDDDGEEEVRVSVLDFPGQMDFYATHSVFLGSVRSVYVLCARADELEWSLRHWLTMLSDMAGRDAGLRVAFAVTHVDKLAEGLAREAAGRIRSRVAELLGELNEYNTFEWNKEHLFLVNYRDEAGCADELVRLREVVCVLAKAESESVMMPHAVAEAWTAARAYLDQRGSALVPRSELERKLQLDAGSAQLVLRMLQGMGEVLAPPEHKFAVLNPLGWMARVLGAIVADTNRTACAAAHALERWPPAEYLEGGLRWEDAHCFDPERVELPGYIGVRALAETEAMPGVDGDSVGGVLALLESQGLCARVRSADETVLPTGQSGKVGADRLAGVLGVGGGTLRGAVFFTLLDAGVGPDASEIWRGGGDREPARFVVGRRVRAPRRRLPPSLFPSLQSAVLREYAKDGSRFKRLSLGRDHLVLELPSGVRVALHRGFDSQLRRESWVDVAVSAAESRALKGRPIAPLERLLYEHLLPFPGVRARVSALCPACLSVQWMGDSASWKRDGTECAVLLEWSDDSKRYRWPDGQTAPSKCRTSKTELNAAEDTWLVGAKPSISVGAPSSEQHLSDLSHMFAWSTKYGDVPVPHLVLLELDGQASAHCRNDRLLWKRCGHHHFVVRYLCEHGKDGNPHEVKGHPGYHIRVDKEPSKAKQWMLQAAPLLFKYVSVSAAMTLTLASFGAFTPVAGAVAAAGIAAADQLKKLGVHADGSMETVRDALNKYTALGLVTVDASATANVEAPEVELKLDPEELAAAALERELTAAERRAVLEGVRKEMEAVEKMTDAEAEEINKIVRKDDKLADAGYCGGLQKYRFVGERDSPVKWICTTCAVVHERSGLARKL